MGHQLATLCPDLFRIDNLGMVVWQSTEEFGASGRSVGIRIGDLQVTPFYETAITVEQHGRISTRGS